MISMRRTTARRCGFTLIELLVAIGIVAALAALTVAAGSAIYRRAEIRQTETVLQQLDQVLKEWEIRADRKIEWSNTKPTFEVEMSTQTADIFTITEVMNVLDASPDLQDLIAGIDPDLLHRYDASDDTTPRWLRTIDPIDPDPLIGNALSQYQSGDWDTKLAVLDAWGRPIRAIHPGRTAEVALGDLVGPDDTDDDGTVFTAAEARYGIAKTRQICFVSAGPDEKFGDISAAPSSDLFKATQDNLYSYEVTRP